MIRGRCRKAFRFIEIGAVGEEHKLKALQVQVVRCLKHLCRSDPVDQITILPPVTWSITIVCWPSGCTVGFSCEICTIPLAPAAGQKGGMLSPSYPAAWLRGNETKCSKQNTSADSNDQAAEGRGSEPQMEVPFPPFKRSLANSATC